MAPEPRYYAAGVVWTLGIRGGMIDRPRPHATGLPEPDLFGAGKIGIFHPPIGIGWLAGWVI